MAFDDEILAGEELLTEGIRSPNYNPGTNGWRIAKEGTAEFNSLSARGDLQSPNYVVNNSGWKIANNGSAEFNSLNARGDIVFNNPLTAENQSLREQMGKMSQVGLFQNAIKGSANAASTATYTSIWDAAFLGSMITLNYMQPLAFTMTAVVDVRLAFGVTVAGAGPLIVRCLVNGAAVDSSVGVVRLNTANDRTMLSQLWTFNYTIPRALPQGGPPSVDIQFRHTSGTIAYNLEGANSTVLVTQFPYSWQAGL